MKQEEIFKYFKKKYKKYDTSINGENIPEGDIPEEMTKKGKWLLQESKLNLADLESLFENKNITVPQEYFDYFLAASHYFTVIEGKLDNFLFEDDVDVEIEVFPQPIGREIEYLKEVILEREVFVKNGYLPIAGFNDDGYLCMDIETKQIGWLSREDCIGLEERNELEGEFIPVFETIDDYIKCFWGNVHYVVPDDLEDS